MPSSKDKQSTRLYHPEESLVEETTSLDAPAITRYPEKELYRSSYNLSEELTLQVLLTRKERWEVKSGTSLEESEMQPERIIRVTSNPGEQQPIHEWDTRISPFFSFAFVTDVAGNLRGNAFIKSLSVFFFILFGSIDALIGSYFLLAGMTVFLGVASDIAAGKLSLQRVNKSILEQVWMLFTIAIMNVMLAVLINQGFLGLRANDGRTLIICWFFFHNILNSLKYLGNLGVPLPEGLKRWVKAIRTTLDGP